MSGESPKPQTKRKNTNTSDEQLQQHVQNLCNQFVPDELQLDLSLYLPYDNPPYSRSNQTNITTQYDPTSVEIEATVSSSSPHDPTKVETEATVSSSRPHDPTRVETEPPVLPSRPQRARKSKRHRAAVKSELIEPPYPWATDRRAKVHTMKHLVDSGIQVISGDVQCKKCERKHTIEYDVQQKFDEISGFVVREQDEWHDRAPNEWTDLGTVPFPSCTYCGTEKSCKPLIAEKKRSVNWLFMFLGQVLVACTLEQLKYFCKHNNIHRTGAKNRLLLYTYLAICKQLQPEGPFHYEVAI